MKIIANVINHSLKSRFARNVLTLMTGTTLAQVVGILVAPILTRLYLPSDYGVSALFGAILSIFGVVMCWRYELSIVLPEKDEEAASLLVLSIIIACSMSVLSLGAVVFLRHPVAMLLGAPNLAPWLWLLPIGLLAAGVFQALNYWCTRKKQFTRLAGRQFTQSFIGAGAQVSAGAFLNVGSGGLIGGSILGQIVATGHLGWQVLKEYGSQIKSCVSKSRLVTQANRYSKFPRFSIMTALLNTASLQLPGLLFSLFFGPTVLGHYHLGHRIFSAPMGIVREAVAQAFYPRAAECYNAGGDLRTLIRRSYLYLGTIVIVPFLILFSIGPWIFGLVFGSKWIMAGYYLRYILPWLTLMFIISPSVNVFPILNKQDFVLIFELVLFVTRLAAVVFGGVIFKNPEWAIGLYGGVGVTANIYIAFKIDRLLREYGNQRILK